MHTIATAIYNEEYIPYLQVFLESIYKIYGRIRVYVAYDKIKAIQLKPTMELYPLCHFDHTPCPDSLSGNLLAAKKMFFWNYILNRVPVSGNLILMDCDMVLVKDFLPIIQQCNLYDIIYTYKTETDEGLNFLLNTGIIIVTEKGNHEYTRNFFRRWTEGTYKILNDTQKHSKARNEWGAADQAYLGVYLGREKLKTGSLISSDGISFRGLPCRMLNETRCTPITENTYVLHYKSGWRKVLKEDTFTVNRPKEKCAVLYDYWKGLYKEVKNKLKKQIKNIYIDAGSNKGQCSLPLIGQYDEIYCLEPAPQFKPYYKDKKVNFQPVAVWVENTRIPFYVNPDNIDTLGCSALKEKVSGNLDKNKPIDVPAIDFSNWLSYMFSSNTHITLRMDVEGAEYVVLEKMLEEKTINLIYKLDVEFHSRKIAIDGIEERRKILVDKLTNLLGDDFTWNEA